MPDAGGAVCSVGSRRERRKEGRRAALSSMLPSALITSLPPFSTNVSPSDPSPPRWFVLNNTFRPITAFGLFISHNSKSSLALRLTSGRQTPHVVSVRLLAWGALIARSEPPPPPNSVSSTFSPPPPHRAAINIAAIGGFALYPPPSLSLRLPLRSLPLALSLS